MDDAQDPLAADLAGLPVPALDQTPEQMALGRRAALELRLQDAKRDLAEVVELNSSLLIQADVQRALASEPGRRAVTHNSAAANLRLKAFLLAPDIHQARLRIANLESQLKDASVQVAPAVLTREQCAAVDSTMGAL